MDTQDNTTTTPLTTMVSPGERALLFSHYEYRAARALGQGLENYDLLMREPEVEEVEVGTSPPDERWLPVRADRYLKHRATGWREAESLEQLPEEWLEQALDREPFPSESAESEGDE